MENRSSSQLRLSSRTKTKNVKGLNGLENIGNTCYMNSVIQCLRHSRALKNYLTKDNYLSDIRCTRSCIRGDLSTSFASVVHKLWNESKIIVNPSEFKDRIHLIAPHFEGNNQEDAHEFLRCLLAALHEDTNRVRMRPQPITKEINNSLSNSQRAAKAWERFLRLDNSKLVDLFVGQFKSRIKCTVCGHGSLTFDPFWDLSVSIPAFPTKQGHVKLSQCLEMLTREEVLDGDEKPTCPKCQVRRKCTKSLCIQKVPEILVIQLNRFVFNGNCMEKLNTTIDFPINGLNMGPYAANRGQRFTYNLYGVSNHSGSIHSGHYIALCKHPHSGEWYSYNDSSVSPIAADNIVSSDAYLLFYELASESTYDLRSLTPD